MKKIIINILVIMAALSVAALAGDEGKGGQPGAFRDMDIGGRPSAMGGAFVAIAEGGVGYLYNPAGLALNRRYSASFAYRAMHLDRQMGYASIAIPAKEEARLSFNWLYAGTDPLEPRNEQGYIIDGEEISYSENLFGVTFAKRFIPWMLLGGRLFYAQNNIANINAYTIGVDFGSLFLIDARKTFLNPAFPLLQAGLSVENLGASYRWTTGTYWETRGVDQGASVDESFPANFRPGLALSNPGRYMVSADLEINTASMVKTHFGGEYTYDRTLSFRAGLDEWHPTFGIGVFKKFTGFGVWIDFSYLTDKVDEGDDVLVSVDVAF